MSPSPSLTMLPDRLAQIQAAIPPTVRLIAVTKQVPSEIMRQAYELGLRDFGESRVQEAAQKQAELQDLPDITWHFIGHLQANKAQKALEQFHWIHSVDNLKLAQRLDRLTSPLSPKPQVCLQVKLRPDPSKHGWSASELLADLPALDQCAQLPIRGLMTIPPLGLESEEILNLFQQTRDLAATIQQHRCTHVQMQQLSMGMSEDYPLAIAAGATMVRLGRILFGERPH